MLLLVFHAGGARFGLEASRIIEVISVPSLRLAPRAEPWLAGLFNYRETVVPVIDLSVLLAGGPARMLWSTRLVVVEWPAADGAIHPLGLLVEHATETIPCDPARWQPAGVQAPDAPYAGEILIGPEGMIQKVEVEKLLPPECREQLFAAAGAES